MEHVTPELHKDEFQKQMEPLLEVKLIYFLICLLLENINL